MKIALPVVGAKTPTISLEQSKSAMFFRNSDAIKAAKNFI